MLFGIKKGPMLEEKKKKRKKSVRERSGKHGSWSKVSYTMSVNSSVILAMSFKQHVAEQCHEAKLGPSLKSCKKSS